MGARRVSEQAKLARFGTPAERVENIARKGWLAAYRQGLIRENERGE
jgi:hypothetical protein